jgi:hypothetical protein
LNVVSDGSAIAAGMTAAERNLGASVTRSAPSLTLEDLTAECLRRLSAQHGIDAAMAFAFNVVRRSTRHAAFIDNIDALQKAAAASLALEHGGTNVSRQLEDRRDSESNAAMSGPSECRNTSESPTPTLFPADLLVGIAPAAFYREMPHTGADGRVLRETAVSLGLRVETIPIHSTGTLAENAAIIQRWLAQHSATRIVLISLCKGGADLKYALCGSPAAFEHVVAWINVCGTLDGSPFAEWLLASKPRFIATWLYFKCQRRNFEMLREIVPAAAGPLAQPLSLPATLRFISVVGFPLRRHLTNAFMRRCHRFIAPAGPNDGGVLIADTLQLPGSLYPVWGADHYLRPDARAAAILAAILRHLAETLSPAAIGARGASSGVAR